MGAFSVQILLWFMESWEVRLHEKYPATFRLKMGAGRYFAIDEGNQAIWYAFRTVHGNLYKDVFEYSLLAIFCEWH